MANALDKLTEKQRQFVLHYLHHFNAAKAARDAGYSEKCDSSIGSENLRKPEIVEAIAEQLDRLGLTAERIKCEVAEIAFDADLVLFDDWLKGKKSLLELQAAGVNTKMLVQAEITDKGRKVKIQDRFKALQELARVRGLVTQHQEHRITGAVPVDYSKMSQEELERQAHAAGLKEPDDGDAGQGVGDDAVPPEAASV